jgi:hypothetical protein
MIGIPTVAARPAVQATAAAAPNSHSLGLLPAFKAGSELLGHLEKVEGFSLDFLRPFLTTAIRPHEVDAVLFELKRFLSLVLLFPGERFQPSLKISSAWHAFVLVDTRQYRKFCNEALAGHFVDHWEGTPQNPIPVEWWHRTKERYEAAFGPPPVAIWGSAAQQRGQMNNFATVRTEVDVQPFLAELAAADDLWHANTRRQERIPVQRETETIFLRGAAPSRAQIRRGVHVEEVHRCVATAEAARFPRLIAFLDSFARERGAVLQRTMIVRLRPEGRVYPHVDVGSYYRKRDRYHLVLDSRGTEMSSGDETVTLRDGELWWFDNKQVHGSRNPTPEWRIHVIFDLLPLRVSRWQLAGLAASLAVLCARVLWRPAR